MPDRKLVYPLIVLVLSCFVFSAATVSFGEDDAATDQAVTDDSPGFYYTVRPGDTLWDLSRKFYDSEWVWPAMWGQNKDLTNPHLIYPGQRIRLYQRTDLPDNKDKIVPLPPVPPPEEVVAQAEPEEQTAPEPVPPVEESIYYEFTAIDSVGFVEPLPRKGLFRTPEDSYCMGKIFKTEGEDKGLLGQGDTIYIQKTGADAFIVGNTYRIYKPITPVDNPVSGKYVGHHYSIIGIAEITSITPEYTVATIYRSFQEIAVGDLIMSFEQRVPKIPLSKSPPDLTGTVIGADTSANIFGEHTIAFINKGKKDGIQVGQQYDVYRQDIEKVDGKSVALPPTVYGKLLVLLVRDTTATVVVTQSDDVIQPGATFKAAL